MGGDGAGGEGRGWEGMGREGGGGGKAAGASEPNPVPPRPARRPGDPGERKATKGDPPFRPQTDSHRIREKSR